MQENNISACLFSRFEDREVANNRLEDWPRVYNDRRPLFLVTYVGTVCYNHVIAW